MIIYCCTEIYSCNITSEVYPLSKIIGVILLTDFYKVKKFVSFKNPSGDFILQNNNGIVKITNKELIQLILEIDKENIKQLDINLIGKFINKVDGVIEFLLKYGVIETSLHNNFNIEEIQFVSNDKEVGELTNYVLKDHLNNSYNYTYTNDITSNININPNNKSLWIVFLNPYSKKIAKKLRDNFLSEKNSYLLTSYIYNNNLYIDSLYSAEWKTPCHICQSSWIESELRGSSSPKMNYQKMVDILYGENEEFEINLSLSNVQIVNIASQLSTRIIQHVGSDKSLKSDISMFGEAVATNLKSFKTHTDTTIHWELCDCYE